MATSLSNCAAPAQERALVSLDEACARAARLARPIGRSESVALDAAVGRVLAEDIFARIPSPRFDQSAMDGYAFAASSLKGVTTELLVSATVTAGRSAPPLPPGCAARIMTGAPIPAGADTVVMQEHIRKRGSTILVDGPIRAGSCIRHVGEDVGEGESLLRAGQRLDPRHLALMGAQGFDFVSVSCRPRVAILSTGDEVRSAGVPLGEFSIYDANKPMLLALAHQADLDVRDAGCVADGARAIGARFAEIATSCDLLITTGGASNGDRDYSAAALADIGAEFEVLSIAVKPGKPAVVGRIGDAVYLGLPGNPVSALVSWLNLGNSIVATLMGMEPRRRKGYLVRTKSAFERRPGRTEFVPARVVSTDVDLRLEILGRGGSARLKPLVDADGLAELTESSGSVATGDAVRFHPFQSGFEL